MARMARFDMEIRRHGEWDYKADALTPEGNEKAKKLAEDLFQFNLVYSSRTNRAIETAEILSKRSRGEIKLSSVLNEIPGYRPGELFNSDFALARAKDVMRFIYNTILLEDWEQQADPYTNNFLIITSGGLLGAIQFYLTRKKPEKLENLHLFRPLEGIHLSLGAKDVSERDYHPWV